MQTERRVILLKMIIEGQKQEKKSVVWWYFDLNYDKTTKMPEIPNEAKRRKLSFGKQNVREWNEICFNKYLAFAFNEIHFDVNSYVKATWEKEVDTHAFVNIQLRLRSFREGQLLIYWVFHADRSIDQWQQ